MLEILGWTIIAVAVPGMLIIGLVAMTQRWRGYVFILPFVLISVVAQLYCLFMFLRQAALSN
jgi:predicted RND superfamily exporter protein